MMRITAVVALFPTCRSANWCLGGTRLGRPGRPTRLGVPGDRRRPRPADPRLGRAMAVPDETMPLVLSLLDQIYTLRGQMRAVARAVEIAAGYGTRGDPCRVAGLTKTASHAIARPDRPAGQRLRRRRFQRCGADA